MKFKSSLDSKMQYEERKRPKLAAGARGMEPVQEVNRLVVCNRVGELSSLAIVGFDEAAE